MTRFGCLALRFVLPLCGLLWLGGGGRAAESTLAPRMTVAGQPLVNDVFATKLPPTWRAVKGTWDIADGVIRGTEVAADQHQAVMRRPLAFRNAVIRFSFRLDHARQISLSINDAKEHVCRVLINPQGFTVQKDDHDHDGPDRPVVFARVSMPISPTEWHTAVVELDGSELVAQIDDGKQIGFGGHELLDRPKANLGFTVAGGPAEFRDLAILAAERRPDWETIKAGLPPPKTAPAVAPKNARKR